MSHLKLYHPDSFESASELEPNHGIDGRVGDGEPVILSFNSHARRFGKHWVANVVDRACLVHENKRCLHCRHPVVEPIELDNSLWNRNNLPIPGTATLVGFHCHKCHAEWPGV